MNRQQLQQTYQTWKYPLSFGFSLGGGFSLIQATVATYFALFLTDTLGVEAGAASILMFLATLLDAVKDPFVGGLVDRTRSRFGRYRGYFLLMPVLFVLSSIFLFFIPAGAGRTAKLIFTMILYVLWGICFSFCLTAGQAALPAQTLDTKKRNQAVMVYTTLMSISFLIASSFTTVFTEWLGGYLPLMIIYGVMTIPPYIAMFAYTTEQYLEPVSSNSFWNDLKTVLKHKELYPVYLVWCMANVSYGIMFSASTYYVLYYLARPDLISGYMLTISFGAMVSMTVGLPIAMKMFKTPQKCLVISQAVTIVCFGILLFSGRSLPLLFVLSFLASVVCSMQHGLLAMLNNDLIDYIQLKDGVSLNATISSIKGFSQKFGSAFINSVILAVLSATGYIAGAVGAQPQATVTAINGLRFILPMIASGVVVVCMLFYPVTRHYPEIAAMKNRLEQK